MTVAHTNRILLSVGLIDPSTGEIDVSKMVIGVLRCSSSGLI